MVSYKRGKSESTKEMKNISEILFFRTSDSFLLCFEKVKWSLILNKAKRKNIIPTKGLLSTNSKIYFLLLCKHYRSLSLEFVLQNHRPMEKGSSHNRKFSIED